MIHAVVTLAVQALLFLMLGEPWWGGAMVAAGYAFREHAQAEQRIIEARYGRREMMPLWGGFTPAAWNRKSLIDATAPMVCAAAMAMILG